MHESERDMEDEQDMEDREDDGWFQHEHQYEHPKATRIKVPSTTQPRMLETSNPSHHISPAMVSEARLGSDDEEHQQQLLQQSITQDRPAFDLAHDSP